MKTITKKTINKVENTEYKVVRVTKTEFELDNGDVYPHVFELDNDVTVEEFQKMLDNSKKLITDFIKNFDKESGE